MKKTIAILIIGLAGAWILKPGASNPKSEEAKAVAVQNAEETATKTETHTPEVFEPYLKLSKKVVPSSEEQEALRKEVSNPELIEKSREILLASDENTWALESQENRLHQVDFLLHALEWPENPARAQALRVVEEIVSRNVRELDQPYLVKKSLAGDQVELFQILRKAEPQLAEKIQAQAGPNRDLIAFAIANDQKGNQL